MIFEHGETVHRIPYGGIEEDPYGNEGVVYGDPETVENAAYQPATSTEPRDAGSQRVLIPATLMVEFDQPCHPLDRWMVRGEVMEVEGEPSRWRNPFTGWEAGTVITLRGVTG